jgi:hypothetical protein
MALLEDQHFDVALLLLSSDWFLPYWELAGLRVPPNQRATIQALARQEVRSLIGTSRTYWEADFDPQGLASARQALFRAIRGDAVEMSRAAPNSVQVEALLRMVLDSCISESTFGQQVGDDVAAEVRECVLRSASGVAAFNFEAIASRSESEWDVYLRSLTPDLPTHLSDFASEQVVGGEFASIWARLVSKLGSQSIQTIVSCLVGQVTILLPEAAHDVKSWLETHCEWKGSSGIPI